MKDESLGDILKKARIKAGFVQKDIANRTGTSVPYVSKIESGRYLPSPKYLYKLCWCVGLIYDNMVELVIQERMATLRAYLKKKYRYNK